MGIKIKVFIWRLIFTPFYRFKYFLTIKERRLLCIMNSVQTINYIIENKCSVCRYGDGEFQMITHYLEHGSSENFHVDTFQNYNPVLAARLLEVYKSSNIKLLQCIPYSFKKSSVYKGYGRTFFEREWLLRKPFVKKNKLYGDSCFTRFWLGRTDVKNVGGYVASLKKLWNKKNVLIVEGAKSRLGVANDLFDNCAIIKRVLCPAVNAFSRYCEILEEVKKCAEKDTLILLALGHTATVMAYDLTLLGYQAIDIGHVDIEYEWYLMRATEKVPVPNKYVNEVAEGRISSDLQDTVYEKQIIAIVD